MQDDFDLDAYLKENEEAEKKFLEQAAEIKRLATIMLEEHFGERCPEYEPGCECCKRWRALDELTQEW